MASGLNWTIPKGMVAPGKTLPPLVVPMNGLTRDAGSGWLAKAQGEARRAAVSRQARAELRAACMAVGYGMSGERLVSAKRCTRRWVIGGACSGSGKGDELHGTEVTMPNDAAREMQRTFQIACDRCILSCILLIHK